MPTEEEVKAYLSKRCGWEVTSIAYCPPVDNPNTSGIPPTCDFCGHIPAYNSFRPRTESLGGVGRFCRDLVACEKREREKQVARIQEKKLWLNEIVLPTCGAAMGYTPDAPPRG